MRRTSAACWIWTRTLAEKLRRLPESQIFFRRTKARSTGPETATGCACWFPKRSRIVRLDYIYECSGGRTGSKRRRSSSSCRATSRPARGDVLRLSNALAHYLSGVESLELADVYREGQVLSRVNYARGAGKVRLGSFMQKAIVTKSRPYWKKTKYVVVVKVPGRKTGIAAAPGYGPERELTARFAQKYPDFPGRSPWPGTGIFGRLEALMPDAYEPSETAFGVVARHCASGLAGTRIVVACDGSKVAVAQVSGARHLYPLESSD